jgi:hypothetical protein
VSENSGQKRTNNERKWKRRSKTASGNKRVETAIENGWNGDKGDRFTYDVKPKMEMSDRLAPDGTDNGNDLTGWPLTARTTKTIDR